MKNLDIEAGDTKLSITNATLVRATLKLGEESVFFHIAEYGDKIRLYFSNSELLCFNDIEVDTSADTG